MSYSLLEGDFTLTLITMAPLWTSAVFLEY